MTSGPKPLTPGKWPAHFLGLAQEISPDYTRNRHWKGKTCQIVRGQNGIAFMHSTNHRNGRFDHCFALSAASPDHYFGVFGCGGWFNSNFTIQNAMREHLDITRGDDSGVAGLQSAHSGRRGYADISRGCMALAEVRLAPHYRSVLKEAAPIVLACVEVAAARPKVAGDSATRQAALAANILSSPTAIEALAAYRAWRYRDLEPLAEMLLAAMGADTLFPHLRYLDAIERNLKGLLGA